MKIHLIRSGGVAGMRREVTVDTAMLDASRAEEIHEVVETAERSGLFRETSVRHSSSHRDTFRYRLTIEDGKGKREVQFSQESASSSAASVVDAVWKAAGPPDSSDLRET